MADTFEKLEELDRLLGDWVTVLVIKLHPFQDTAGIGKIERKHIVLLENDFIRENYIVL